MCFKQTLKQSLKQIRDFVPRMALSLEQNTLSCHRTIFVICNFISENAIKRTEIVNLK